MPSEIFYSESDSGRLQVAGTDATPQLDQAAGREVQIPSIAPGTLPAPMERIYQGLCRASVEDRNAFRVATLAAEQAGEVPPAEVITEVSQRPDAVRVLTQIAADPETRQRFRQLKNPDEIKAAVKELDEERPFSLAEWRKKRDRQARSWLGGVGREE